MFFCRWRPTLKNWIFAAELVRPTFVVSFWSKFWHFWTRMSDGMFELLTIGQFVFLFSASSFVFISLTTLMFKLRKQTESMTSSPIRINIFAWIFTSAFNLVYVSISIVSKILPSKFVTLSY